MASSILDIWRGRVEACNNKIRVLNRTIEHFTIRLALIEHAAFLNHNEDFTARIDSIKVWINKGKARRAAAIDLRERCEDEYQNIQEIYYYYSLLRRINA